MASETRQLRGWKEIGAYLHTSERTAKRWETLRGLPIRRIQGASRDVVFACADELDSWLQFLPEQPRLADDQTAGSRRECEETNAAYRRGRTSVAFGVIGISLACLVAYGVYRGSAHPGAFRQTAASPRPATSRLAAAVVLRITTPNAVATRVTVPDGQCAAIGLSGHPQLTLCPRLLGDGLLLDVADAAPAGDADPASPVTLRLDLLSAVRVVSPVRFDVEWLERVAPVSSALR